MAEEIPVAEIPLEDILDEIDVEEKALEDDRNRLTEAKSNLDNVKDDLEWEKLPSIEERIHRERERIQRLEERIKKRTADIEETYRNIGFQMERRPYPRSGIQRLRRRIPRLEGWQTRQTRSITTLEGWITKGERFIDRQKKLRDEEDYWKKEIDAAQSDIAHEEDRLKQKHERVKMVQAQITLVSITTSMKMGEPYEKRFQGFYLIDCIRIPETGLFDLNAPLTQNELETCINDFYLRWGWIDENGEPKLPLNTTEPRLTDISNFELITEAQGAWFLKCSVIERGEEDTFGKKEQIYEPTPQENEEFKKYALSSHA